MGHQPDLGGYRTFAALIRLVGRLEMPEDQDRVMQRAHDVRDEPHQGPRPITPRPRVHLAGFWNSNSRHANRE